MLCAVGVPQREYRVVCKAVGLMYFHIVASVLAVNIHIYRRVNHGVVHRGIEQRLLVFCTLNLHCTKFFLPLIGSFPTNLVEGLTLCLCL